MVYEVCSLTARFLDADEEEGNSALVSTPVRVMGSVHERQ